jgi:protein O-mannosyl-transferase
MSKQNSKQNTPKVKTKISSENPEILQTAIAALPDWLKNPILQLAIIGILSCALYANTFSHDYTQDDAIVIYDNMYTTKGVKGISGILGKDTFFGFFKEEGKQNLVSGGRYRPFTLVMFAIENQIFGTVKKDDKGNVIVDKDKDPVIEYSKFWGHFFNVFWYMITCMVVLITLRRLLKDQREDIANIVPFVATLIFTAHPIHTEAVANIKGRDEIIALLGSLSALYFAIKAYEKSNFSWAILSAVFFFIGIMSKENSVAFLAVIPMAFWFFTKADLGKIIKYTAPAFVSMVVFLIFRFQAIGAQFGGEPPVELMNNPYLKFVNGQYIPFSFGEKFAAITFTLGKYIQLLFAPFTLTHDYYPRHIEIMGMGNLSVLLSLAIYIALLYFAFKGFFQKSIVSFGILFFLATMFIISNVLFPIGTNMSERFMFMPSVGFSLVIAYLLLKLVKKTNIVLAVTSLVFLVFSFLTISRNFVWRSNYSLFLTDVKTSVNSAKLQNAAGGELITQSLLENSEVKRNEMQTEAVGHLEKAIKIHPTYRNAYLLLGNAHNYLKNYDKSIKAYEDGLKVDPTYVDLKNNLAVTYREAAKVMGEKGNPSGALSLLEKAYSMNQKDAETIRLLGVANGMSGNAPKALEWFDMCVKMNPQNAHAWWDLGTAYIGVNNMAKSNESRAKALQLDPNIVQNMQKPQK